MAGHNKWSKIKHRKAVVDKRRGKVWTKVAKAIIVAARNSGPDPASNLSLRYAIDEARYANMPRDTIERAIKKGSGGEDTSTYEAVRYEGYGPGGAAIIADALTDNRTRTVTDVRLAFTTHGGNLGASGCVGYMFLSRGRVAVGVEDNLREDGDRLMEVAANAGASDVEPPETSDDSWTVWTEPQDFLRVKDAVEAAGFTVHEAEIAMVPSTRVEARGEAARQLIDLVEALEELDDVQKVYANFDVPDEELARLA